MGVSDQAETPRDQVQATGFFLAHSKASQY